MSYNMVDLFAGTGAFSYAFRKHDINCNFANDMCEFSKLIFDLNHDIQLTLGDLNMISSASIPKHNILCAGFPCQPFSIAGKQEGFDDERSNVFWKILDILKEHNTEIVILENVKNLTSHDKGNTFRVIEFELIKLGYHIKYQVLNTSTITNIPQHRERIYMVCFKNENMYNKFDFDFPNIECKPITDMLISNCNESYYYSNKYKIYDIVKNGIDKHINTNTLYQYRRYYVRENKSNECPTLTANMGTGGHNVPLLRDDMGIRKLTPRECFNFQGFPMDYNLPDISDNRLYTLAGNAVSLPVVELIAKKISSLLLY